MLGTLGKKHRNEKIVEQISKIIFLSFVEQTKDLYSCGLLIFVLYVRIVLYNFPSVHNIHTISSKPL